MSLVVIGMATVVLGGSFLVRGRKERRRPST
jgi:hypothetical protein